VINGRNFRSDPEFHMDRGAKRLTKTRAAALLGTVIFHGLIIMWALSIKAFTTSTIPSQSIQLLAVDKPPRSRADEKFPALQMHELKPVLAPMAVPDLEIPPEPPPPQALASEETSESKVSVVASNGAPSISSNGSGAASNGNGEDLTVAHRVQPIYSDASVRAREQGYVVVGLLIDAHGAVRKAQVVQSSGFRRLDQSAVDALRQWTFKRAAGAPAGLTWTTLRYGFHLASSNAPDLSAVNLALLQYEPALAEQIRASTLPIVATNAPKPSGAAALRRLIADIQTAAPLVGRNFLGPQAPAPLIIKLGAVKSIQFLAFESHGLDVNAAPTANTQHSQDSQWELYEVTQTGGTSEWLLDVSRRGGINTAQVMICTPDHDGMIGCL
jgi:TonB family protein